MTQVVVDANLRSKLHDLTLPLELCDEQGQVLGRFLPGAAVRKGTEPPPLSEEELRCREQEPDYSTAEVLAHLERV